MLYFQGTEREKASILQMLTSSEIVEFSRSTTLLKLSHARLSSFGLRPKHLLQSSFLCRFRVQPTYGQAIKKRNPCRSSAFSFRKLPIRQVNNFFLSDLIEIIFSCLFGRNQQIIYTLARAKFQPSTLIHRFRVRPAYGHAQRKTKTAMVPRFKLVNSFETTQCNTFT